MSNTPTSIRPSDLSLVVIQLMKGPVYKDGNEKLWDALVRLHSRVSDYVATIGLHFVASGRSAPCFCHSLPAQKTTASATWSVGARRRPRPPGSTAPVPNNADGR
jgi:hypothetical protein